MLPASGGASKAHLKLEDLSAREDEPMPSTHHGEPLGDMKKVSCIDEHMYTCYIVVVSFTIIIIAIIFF